ncbi:MULTISPECIES: hypothetical protein [unclassified Serratia (in: enterobacteria)]|uniref:hypothetical protein n=1 Tax=unclassified Serratia (in: enterobacteria) TaxID=2647522 RepID=UPI0012678ACC|nr:MULTISPECIES: hypothetical protein [unclassified Serratia (in: enterobacteria)]
MSPEMDKYVRHAFGSNEEENEEIDFSPPPDLSELQHQPLPFPIEEFVPLLQDAIIEIQRALQLPAGMIATALLAGASYGCQSFIEVISRIRSYVEYAALV